MGENAYFRDALAHFTQEAASGGAIRHLADLGYSVKQIAENLDFPTPYGKVQAAVWAHFLETGVILPGRPGGAKKEKAVYVKEYDKYGKTSFRRIVETREEQEVCWRERILMREEAAPAGRMYSMLRARQEENGVENSYMSCDFGLLAEKEPGQYEEMLKVLEEKQREYISGLPWEKRRVYHRLDSSMLDILVSLYEKELYQGECCFSGTREIIVLT